MARAFIKTVKNAVVLAPLERASRRKREGLKLGCTTQRIRAFKAAAAKAEVGDSIEQVEEEEEKSDAYSSEMQNKMGGSLTYRHEDGMNFAYITDEVIVGSCLQNVQDLDRLVDEEGVGSILCLQQDSDMAYFNLDLHPILERVNVRGDVHHIRYRINDFDPFSLRTRLPGAATIVAREIAQGRKVYIHCTAGLGRAPATALAFMYWFQDFSLEDAFQQLRSVRPCNPRLQAIREATCDVLVDKGQKIKAKLIISRSNKAPQVAGLDAGWGQRMDMTWNAKKRHFVLERDLPAGKFPFKLLYGDHWTTSADHPTLKDGDITNNFLEVVSSNADPKAQEARRRLLAEGGCLTAAEKEEVRQRLHEKFASGIIQ